MKESRNCKKSQKRRLRPPKYKRTPLTPPSSKLQRIWTGLLSMLETQHSLQQPKRYDQPNQACSGSTLLKGYAQPNPSWLKVCFFLAAKAAALPSQPPATHRRFRHPPAAATSGASRARRGRPAGPRAAAGWGRCPDAAPPGRSGRASGSGRSWRYFVSCLSGLLNRPLSGDWDDLQGCLQERPHTKMLALKKQNPEGCDRQEEENKMCVCDPASTWGSWRAENSGGAHITWRNQGQRHRIDAACIGHICAAQQTQDMSCSPQNGGGPLVQRGTILQSATWANKQQPFRTLPWSCSGSLRSLFGKDPYHSYQRGRKTPHDSKR